MKKDKPPERDKPPKIKPQKPPKVKSDKPQKPLKKPKDRDLRKLKVMRIVLYTLLIGIFVIGVFRIMQGDRTQELRAEMKTIATSVQGNVNVHTEAQAFAQGFIKAYLTYENRLVDDYKKRLGQYCTQRLVSEMTENIIFKNKAEVIYSQAIDIAQYASNQYDVTVMAEIRYTKRPETSGYTSFGGTPEEVKALPDEITQDVMYFIVPVWSDGDGGYVVEDIPRITAPPMAAEYNRQDFSGSIASDADKAAAQKMLEDFFRTLYSETQNKIDYYLAETADKNKFTALELSGIKFVRIESVSLYKTSSADEFIAIVSIKISDVNGTELKQRFNMYLVRKDKFFAKDINSRTYSLRV